MPVISEGQMNRIVRAGAGMRLASTSAFSVRAISRMAAQPLALSFAPGNRRDQGLVGDGVVVARAHHGVNGDVVSAAEPLLQGARLANRDHDRERVVPPARIQMAPADEVLVVAPPGAHLIGGVADEPRRPALFDRLAVARRGRRVAEHEPPAHVLAVVVAGLRPAADVDQLRGQVGALAVVRHGQAHVVHGGDAAR
ncbi:MAG: hypothetical protein DMF77_14510 [Acidobacteria bacterium]|nr:MAG: hypothetical protein DMF77_14510 [Acidobacteriota bacterium]